MKIIVLILSLITVLSLFACRNGKQGAVVTTDPTYPDTTDSVTTEGDTTIDENTTVEITTDPNAPIYEDGGFTYKVDVRDYLEYIAPEDDSAYLIIANRKNPLGSSYVPKNLVAIDGGSYKLNSVALKAFEAMRLEMKALGVYDTHHQSTYRSYSYQANLYQKYIDREREKYPYLNLEQLKAIVDTYSARPGTSDHQTGLTIDFSPINSSFASTKAYKYLKENAHKFGFIMRYPGGKENITGYKQEQWHWRFVGRDAATYIYEHGITLEEYMAEMKGTAVETFPPTSAIPSAPPDETEPDEEDTTETTVTDPVVTGPEETTDITTDQSESTTEVTSPPDTTTSSETTAPESTTEATTTESVTTTEATTTESVTTTEAITTTEAVTTSTEENT